MMVKIIKSISIIHHRVYLRLIFDITIIVAFASFVKAFSNIFWFFQKVVSPRGVSRDTRGGFYIIQYTICDYTGQVAGMYSIYAIANNRA